MEEAVAKKKSPVGKIIFLLVVFAAGLCCYIASGKLTTESLLPAILFFIAGLACLIKGGDWFVDGATAIAKKFKIPEILIGATVVSIGTTLPEVMVSAQAAAKGSSSISYGNAIGSIICNAALIAAITLAVKPAKVDKKPLRLPVIFFFIAAAFYAFNAYYFGSFSRTTGILLLVTFLVYMFFVIRQAITKMKKGEVEEKPEEEEEEAPESIPVALLLLVFGAAIIAFGANLLVDNGIIIARSGSRCSGIRYCSYIRGSRNFASGACYRDHIAGKRTRRTVARKYHRCEYFQSGFGIRTCDYHQSV